MHNYFDFLTDEEQEILNAGRFKHDLPLELIRKVRDGLKGYGVRLKENTRIPANHQMTAFSHMASNLDNGVTFFAELMEQGLGKTKLAIMYADLLYARGIINGMLIISPNDLKYQWVEEEMVLHFPGHFDGHIWEGCNSQKERRAFSKFITEDTDNFKVFSVNVEAFSHESVATFVRGFANSRKDYLIVVDESTSIKNARRKPKRTDSKRGGAKRSNKILDGFRRRNHKLILTGTATPNRPFDIWAQYEFLYTNYFGMDYWDFCKFYGEMIHVKRSNAKCLTLELLDEKTFSLVKNDLKRLHLDECMHRGISCRKLFCEKCDKFTAKKLMPYQLEEIALRRGLTESGIMRINNMEKLEQFKHLDDLRSKMAPVTFFCKTEEVMDMPEKVFKVLPSVMSAEQKRVYKSMMDDMMAEYEGDYISTLHKQVMYMRCQQISGGLFPYPVEVMKQVMEDEFMETHYETKPMKDIGKLKSLATSVEDNDPDQSVIYWAWFTGEQDLIYDMLCSKFGSSKVGLYRNNKKEVEGAFKGGEIKHFVSGDSGAFGLNLQISHLLYFYSNNYRGDIRDQKEKRAHRMGQTYPVTYVDCITKGTKDAKIVEVLKNKLDLMDYFRKGGEF